MTDLANLSRSFEGRVEVLRRNRLLLGVPVALLILALVLLAATMAGASLSSQLQFVEIVGGFWGAVMTPIILYRNPFPARLPRAARVDASGLWLNGELAMHRDEITQGYVEPVMPSHAVLHLRARGRKSLVLSASPEVAEGILSALALDPVRRTATISGRSPLATPLLVRPALWVLFQLTLVLGPIFLSTQPLLLLFTLCALLALLVLSYIPARIDVGADGVLRSWLGTRRFLPYRDMRKVTTRRDDVVVEMQNGQRSVLAARRRYDAEANQGADDLALLHRVQTAFRWHRSTESPADSALALARGGRPAREWVRQIRALCASQGSGYRSSGLSEERLLQVVRDASALPSLRAGAAVALAQAEGDAWKSDLRTVAEACADPRVRVVLETVAQGGEEEDWVSALEGMGEDEPTTSNRTAVRS
jgi:hypothetical protein